MTIMLSFGRWGGFYVRTGYAFRVCLGFVALTIMPQDIDKLLHANKVYREMLLSMGERLTSRMLHGPGGGDRDA